ncbi:uncharacterized protein TRUGW13939_10253 [Talaromyces rugulosus]|uniref:Uncharacterized protein n=1 Tax=Talaromyces rugulosus TaxID=121627 RepID=A0A7H8RC71_TALRU|nr:uncharacterized protein TRUGW13939_10253 [Talaromyces rugulosus]QKX63085.1 hypothetical protein TRUGW13939_10253 [Talaromyces rugulosus]
MSGLIGKVSSGVGLVAEARQHHKAKKAAERARTNHENGVENGTENLTGESQTRAGVSPYNETSPRPSPMEETDGLEEAQWQLDEAQDELVGGSAPRKNKQGTANPDKVVQAFLDRQSLPDTTQLQAFERVKLEYPVLLPQRRPRDKKRGFIRAYAPDLQSKGIDQELWLDLIETLNESSLANPWINAINLAALATNALPSAIGFAVSTAIMIATQIAMEAQGRYRQNKSLARLNDEFFRPRGLYCLVMTWDPKSHSSRVNIDVNTTIKNSASNPGGMSRKFQSSSGTTTEFEFMQTAQLVFPGLDYIAAAPGEEAKGIKNKLKRSKNFVTEYMDRKAQAEFVGENPDNLLSNELNPTFASKYADPNHPIHSGSLVSLVSLGYINPKAGRSSGGLLGGGGLIGSALSGRRERTGRFGEEAYDDRNSYGSDRGFGLGGGRSRRGGGGLIGGLVGMATEAVRNRGQQHGTAPQQGYGDDTYRVDEYQHQQQQGYTQTQRAGARGPDRSGRGGPLGIKKLLAEKVLYLMVVNMPTEGEMSEARRITAEWDAHDEPPPYEEVEM